MFFEGHETLTEPSRTLPDLLEGIAKLNELDPIQINSTDELHHFRTSYGSSTPILSISPSNSLNECYKSLARREFNLTLFLGVVHDQSVLSEGLHVLF